MPLTQYLARDRVIELSASSKAKALGELAERASTGIPGLAAETVLCAVQAREKEIGTSIAPGVALPHARLPGIHRFVIAVGRSRRGIRWGAAVEEPVHLIVMLLGGQGQSSEHLAILAELASVLRRPGLLERIREADSADDVHALLVGTGDGGVGAADDRDRIANRALFAHACAVAEETGAAALILHTDERLDPDFVGRRTPALRLILATNQTHKGADAAGHSFDAVVQVPHTGIADEHRLEFALLLALSQGLLDNLHQIVCVWGRAGSGRLDSLSVVDIDEDYAVLQSLRSELRESDIAPQVLNRLLDLASGLAAEGREGKPIGTILVVGDYGRVAEHCHQMVINPFKGYPDEQRNLLDPSLEETVKEFSSIDGAFVIRGDGVIMSAGTYLAAEGQGLQVPKGLGTRHTAAAAITAVTGALAVVVSESTGAVSLFMRGQLLLALKRA
jgi:DNA integrity scanning protein DisA with diadenylate cyclase activity/mannitol/fructose-specific phosphotransferase system IIA component (Ntr-type)